MNGQFAAYKTIEVLRENGIFTLTLSRPPLNILNIAMIEEIGAALREAKGSPFLVLRGRGKAFSAGADVGDHLPGKVAAMLEAFHGAVKEIVSFDGIVIACVHGAALGGGCELVLPADIVLASSEASFGQPEIQLGVFPPVAMVLLPELCPRAAATEMILTGRTVGAQDALNLGLASRVYPPEEFDEKCGKYILELSGMSRSSLKLTKRVLRRIHPGEFAAKLRDAQEAYLNELMKTPDATEGCAAFLEKRRPEWSQP